jgi:hypothetical protein
MSATISVFSVSGANVMLSIDSFTPPSGGETISDITINAKLSTNNTISNEQHVEEARVIGTQALLRLVGQTAPTATLSSVLGALTTAYTAPSAGNGIQFVWEVPSAETGTLPSNNASDLLQEWLLTVSFNYFGADFTQTGPAIVAKGSLAAPAPFLTRPTPSNVINKESVFFNVNGGIVSETQTNAVYNELVVEIWRFNTARNGVPTLRLTYDQPLNGTNTIEITPAMYTAATSNNSAPNNAPTGTIALSGGNNVTWLAVSRLGWTDTSGVRSIYLTEDQPYEIQVKTFNGRGSNPSVPSNTLTTAYSTIRANAPTDIFFTKVPTRDDQLRVTFRGPDDAVALNSIGVNVSNYIVQINESLNYQYSTDGSGVNVSSARMYSLPVATPLPGQGLLTNPLTQIAIGGGAVVNNNVTQSMDPSGFVVTFNAPELKGVQVNSISITPQLSDPRGLNGISYGRTGRGSLFPAAIVNPPSNVSITNFAGITTDFSNNVPFTVLGQANSYDVSGAAAVSLSINGNSFNQFTVTRSVNTPGQVVGSNPYSALSLNKSFGINIPFANVPGQLGDMLSIVATLTDVSGNATAQPTPIRYRKQALPSAPVGAAIGFGSVAGQIIPSYTSVVNGTGLSDASANTQVWFQYQIATDASGLNFNALSSAFVVSAVEQLVIPTGATVGHWVRGQMYATTTNLYNGETLTSQLTTISRQQLTGVPGLPANFTVLPSPIDASGNDPFVPTFRFSFTPPVLPASQTAAQAGLDNLRGFRATFATNGTYVGEGFFDFSGIQQGSNVPYTITVNAAASSVGAAPSPAPVNPTANPVYFAYSDASLNFVTSSTINIGANAFTWGDVMTVTISGLDRLTNVFSLVPLVGSVYPYCRSTMATEVLDVSGGFDRVTYSITPNGSPIATMNALSIFGGLVTLNEPPVTTFNFSSSAFTQGTGAAALTNNVNAGFARVGQTTAVTFNSPTFNSAFITRATLTGTTTSSTSLNVNNLRLVVDYNTIQGTNTAAAQSTGLKAVFASAAGVSQNGTSANANTYWNMAARQG